MTSLPPARHLSLIAFLLLLLPLLAACPPRIVREIPRNDTEREALLAQILQQRSGLQSLEGRAKLRITEGKKRRTLQIFYMMQRPNRLYLEVIAALQQPGVIITSDGKRFGLHNMLQKEFLHGHADQLPALLNQYLPTSLPLEQLIAALLGDPPLLPAKERRWKNEKDSLALHLQGNTHQQRLWIDPQAQHIQRVLLDWVKKPALSVEYDGFQGQPALPRVVNFALPSRGLAMKWIFLEQKRNPAIAPKHFQQSPPKETTIREIFGRNDPIQP